MDSLDLDLRRVLTDQAVGSIDVEEALASVHERHRRRTARRAVVAAIAAAVAVVGVVGIVSSSRDGHTGAPVVGSPEPTSEVVPWSDLTDYETGPTILETRPATTRCLASNLQLAGVQMEGAGGHSGTFVDVRNVGGTRCTIGGYPALLGRDHSEDGPLTEIAAEHDTFFRWDQQERPATIDPGEKATTVVETSLACGSQTAVYDYRDLQLVLDDGTRLPLHRDLASSCPIRTDTWYRNLLAPEPPNRFKSLEITIEPPQPVRPGETLEYVVRLRNGGDDGVALEPCPGFRQFLTPWPDTSEIKPGKPIAYGDWRLNCDPARILAPGGTVRFAMRIDVPDDVASEALFLEWQLIDSRTSHTASARVDVAG